jgi:hypothetical protein
MPSSIQHAINFLETQWSSINDNKIKGIAAELAFKDFLNIQGIHFIPGGWIMSPGNKTLCQVPAREKVCLLPRNVIFSWQASATNAAAPVTPAEISAYNYFRQVGVRAYLVCPSDIVEATFSIPQPSHRTTRATYPKNYHLDFMSISQNGELHSNPVGTVFQSFPIRNGNSGLRCSQLNRIAADQAPWNDSDAIARLFWFEYTRYFVQVDYLVSNIEEIHFIIAPSGSCFPVELKSKSVVNDNILGDWFGIDMGAFAKLALFTANSMNTDALYVVQEVYADRNHVEWYGLRFTELVKSCSWAGQAGGTGLMGGSPSTFKVPKAAFTRLVELLPAL